MGNHRVFRSFWWASNALLALDIVGTLATGMWERSVREYVKGFSDAVIPESSTPREKVEAILTWMRVGPPRREARDPSTLSSHDPTDTLNYRQLLTVCGSATNAFLNLSRSAGLETRRLLLLNPDRTAKHVVAEVKLDGRWVVVDATYRVMMKDARGNLLTRKDLQDPKVFQEAMRQIPGYISEYSYERLMFAWRLCPSWVPWCAVPWMPSFPGGKSPLTGAFCWNAALLLISFFLFVAWSSCSCFASSWPGLPITACGFHAFGCGPI